MTHEIKVMGEKMKEITGMNDSQSITIRKQEQRLAELVTDNAHWERKSASLSKELGKFSGTQMQQVGHCGKASLSLNVMRYCDHYLSHLLSLFSTIALGRVYCVYR